MIILCGMDISNEQAAILGILYEHHHYPHRIQEIMEKRGMDNWANIDIPSVYSILNNLEEKGLVESNLRNVEGKPALNVYSITNEGRTVLKRKIKLILSKKGKSVHSFDLGLANINVLDNDEIIQSLEIYLKTIDEHINYLEDSIKVQKNNHLPYNFIAIYSRSVSILKAEKTWIKEFIEKIR